MSTTTDFCRECGAALLPDDVRCPRCRLAIAAPVSARRATFEVLRYVLVFAVVMLVLLLVIEARRVWFLAVLLQGVLPFLVFLILTFVVVRFWKR